MEYLWPDTPGWANMVIPLSVAFSQYWGTWFARSYLRTDANAPFYSSALAWISYGSIVVMVVSVAGAYTLSVKLATGLGLLESVLILLAARASYRNGYRPALFLLVAFSALFPGVVLFCLQSLAIIPSNIFTSNAFQAGAALDALLLSFGLADRINAMKAERELAQRTALSLQERFSHRLLERQEAERKRIASELHDGIGQNLLVINDRLNRHINKAQADNMEISEDLELASAVAGQSIEEAREISHSLHPHILDKLGLTKAVESTIRNSLNSTGIELDMKVDNLDGLFSKRMDIHIYRIAQEGTSNILKHSHATRAQASFTIRDKTLHVTIRDNGQGMNAEKLEKGGLGLASIAERIKILGGTFTLDSAPGKGTAIHIHVPTQGGSCDEKNKNTDSR